MSYQKQIHDYLNGDLTPDEEKKLFDELSDNPALREELAMQIKLQQTVQKDIASNAISPATTAAIFSALNFTVPHKDLPAPHRRFGFAGKSFGANAMIAGFAFATALFSLIYVLSRPSDAPTLAQRRSNTLPVLDTSVKESIKNGETNDRHTSIQNGNTHQATTHGMKAYDRLASAEHSENVYRRTIPNEPMKAYFDIGKFSSVDYLTPMKIIGVADGGMIYYSDNGGKSWIIQASGTSRDLSGINFVDTTQGIIVGARGTILLTDNAGAEWRSTQSGIDANLITIRYATRDTVYACGAKGTIIRSITGGKTWEKLESGTRLNLFKLFFENGASGFVTGEHGVTLETHNGGASWSPKK
jgi:hypothetical protein